MDEFHVRRSARVEAADGPIGYVEHIVVDPQSGQATDLVIANKGHCWLVPISAVSAAQGDRVILHGAWARYHEAGTLPSTALRALEPAGTAASDGSQGLSLLEERLDIGKANEQAGLVRIGKQIREHTETIRVPVRADRFVVEQRPGGGRVTIDGRELGSGETVELPLMRERVVVTKAPVVAETVTIRKEILEHTQRVQQPLRREELQVEDPAGLVSSADAGAAHPRRPSSHPPSEARHGVQR